MYVNRLIEFAEKHDNILPPLGFKYKKIDWIVDVEESDFSFNFVSKEYSVPEAARSSNTKPFLIVDKPDYVFGIYDKEKDRLRSHERHESYKALLNKYVEATKDEDVQLLLKNLEQVYELPKAMKLNHFIAFRIRNEELLHQSKKVEEFWGEYIQPEIDDKSTVLPCMFCHQKKAVMERHTINFLIGPDQTKMISANENAYESHGLKKSFSAPTCYVCEQKYGKALEYMLQRNKNKDMPGGPHMFRIGDITYVYWLREKQQLDNMMDKFASPNEKQTPKDMKDLLQQVFKGVSTDRNVHNFCLLALSSHKGRLVVREYIEDSAGKIKQRIESFLKAQEVGGKRYYGIYTLAATMYSEPRNQMQKYPLEEWMGWFLYGRPLSGRILLPILRRIQVADSMYPQFASAVKSWLVSQNKGGKWSLETHEQNQSKAYLTGRAFAILEYIQQKAIDSNNTIAAKYFGSASTTPRSIMGLLIRNAQNHLSKLKNDPKTRYLANHLENKMGQVLTELKSFPPTLKLEEQAEFALGYYFEKQQAINKKTIEGEVSK